MEHNSEERLDCRATVIIPTTADRGPLLVQSVASALRQTIDDVEIFIIGDGVSDDARTTINQLVEADPRVRFFDFAKHERRGEPYRHEVLLNHASGRFVAYLCDRDLWLPRHLEVCEQALVHHHGVHTLRFSITPEGEMQVPYRSDLSDPSTRERLSELAAIVPLSTGCHTMDAYRKLPHGWRTTPAETQTDRYMWEQMLGEAWFTMAVSFEPTVLWFKRGDHPGWPVEKRRAELDAWAERMVEPDFEVELGRQIIEAMGRDQYDMRNRLAAASPLVRVRNAVPQSALERVRRVYRRLPAGIRSRVRRASITR